MDTVREPLVTTLPERCRMCYTCVRECPAKAIRMLGGQAEIIHERCIGCGNCVRICSQNAKRVRSSVLSLGDLLASGKPTAAIVAPSFPAEFDQLHPRQFVGILREMGFRFVCEVAFGADLVAEAYRQLRYRFPARRFIATSCPALVQFIQKYHPSLVADLAPIVSPMVAMARYLKAVHGSNLRIVFIGPCIAKKDEAFDPQLHEEVDVVLTFAELRDIIKARHIDVHAIPCRDFDPPTPELGVLFPISRGMLQAAKLDEDLLEGDVVAADGRQSFIEAIKEFETYELEARLLEVLCCTGCIMGPGMTTSAPLFRRRASVSRYARYRMAHRGPAKPVVPPDLDLSRTFAPDDQRLPGEDSPAVDQVLKRMGKHSPVDELNCGACGYDTCREHAIAIIKGLAESEMCLPHTIDRLRHTVHDLEVSHDQLTDMQAALVKAERLASMGQLAAGIAHEINNPLGIVLMYAHLVLEDLPADDRIADDLRTIVAEADRCKGIVSGLLNFARRNKLSLQRVNVARLVDRYLRAFPKRNSIVYRTSHATSDLVVDLDADQITQVLTNLVTNAEAAIPESGTILIETGTENDEAYFRVSDTGRGIPPENVKKIFEPFFTTKAPGAGTGLGLAVSYGIVKMHHGQITVESRTDPAKGPTGTTFTVRLPLALSSLETGEPTALDSDARSAAAPLPPSPVDDHPPTPVSMRRRPDPQDPTHREDSR